MNWKLILQQSWKKTLLVGGLLFVIGCAISFFLFANKMAVLIGLPFWFYEKGIIPSLGDLEDHTIFLTISLLADMLFWLLVAFFAAINKKFRWVVILILLVITVFTIWNFYGKSQSVQTGAPPSPVELCETDNDCINVITGDTKDYKAQACVNKNYKDYNLQPYDYPGKILSETGEDKCDCSQMSLGETTYKICGLKSEIDISNWVTYWNDKYGLEFKHPANLVMQKRLVAEPSIYWDGKLNDIPYVMTLGYISQDALNTMGINYCGAHPEDTRCENFEWDNLAARIDWNIETEGAFTQSRAEIQHPNDGIVIISIDHRPTQDIKPFFRQIISTFKFTK